MNLAHPLNRGRKIYLSAAGFFLFNNFSRGRYGELFHLIISSSLIIFLFTKWAILLYNIVLKPSFFDFFIFVLGFESEENY